MKVIGGAIVLLSLALSVCALVVAGQAARTNTTAAQGLVAAFNHTGMHNRQTVRFEAIETRLDALETRLALAPGRPNVHDAATTDGLFVIVREPMGMIVGEGVLTVEDGSTFTLLDVTPPLPPLPLLATPVVPPKRISN